MTSPHAGDFANAFTTRDVPAEPGAIAAAVCAYLLDELKAKPGDVILTHEPASYTVTFFFPGSLTGSVRISGPRTLSLSYIVANMWEYREQAEFETLEELCGFLARLIQLVRRFSHTTLGASA